MAHRIAMSNDLLTLKYVRAVWGMLDEHMHHIVCAL